MSETEKKKILLIATGGTIASAQGGEGLSPAVKPEEAASVLRILEAAQVSSREKRRIPLV